MRRLRRNAGISTAEVLAGSALSLIALAAIYSFQRAQSKALLAQNAYAESQTVTRQVMDIMTRELRMASFDPTGLALTTSGPGTCPGVKQGIVAAGSTSIRFKQDLNADGACNTSGEDITYDVLGTSIRRTDGGGAPVAMVDGVPSGGFSLRYFDNSNPPVEIIPIGSPPALTPTQRDCVAKIRVNVKADIPNPTLVNPLASLAESEVAIRNRSLTNF